MIAMEQMEKKTSGTTAVLETKKRQLLATVQDLEKRYGKGILMKLDDKSSLLHKMPTLSTGSLLLDRALGVGGFPYGRIVEIYGPESSGKTTLALHTIASVQKKGGTAVLVDSEHAFDRNYASNLGVDVPRLLVTQPDSGEQALEIVDTLIRSKSVDLVVVDSVAALVPKAELDGEIGDKKLGAQARLMSQALRKLTGTISKTQSVCLFINQLRQKIGVTFGNPEVTPGGNALKFYASMRVDVRRGLQLKKAGEESAYGHQVKAKVVKNKVAPPFKTAQFDLIYGKGISNEGEIIDLALSLQIINQAGSWFSFNKTKLGQGKESVREKIKNDLKLRAELLKIIQQKIL